MLSASTETFKKAHQTGNLPQEARMHSATIEIVRGELERLFSLEEMTSMSQQLLGLDPQEIGGSSAKASFARALAERCMDGDRIEALVDVILISRREVDPRVRDIVTLLGKEEHPAGKELGGFKIQKKLGESDLGIVYLAARLGAEPQAVPGGSGSWALKILKREATRDRRAVHRFLTANRLVAGIDHVGLPKHIEAGETADGGYYVAYDYIDAQPLAARFARTGPAHINELKAIIKGILDPLAALHKAHLVHGDLKLENVLLGKTLGNDVEQRECEHRRDVLEGW